jgi:large subunit ribosomal protein L30
MMTKTATNKSGKTITVQQTGSAFNHKPGMRETIIGLGLRGMNSVKVLEDTPAVRGMIHKVRHLVTVKD